MTSSSRISKRGSAEHSSRRAFIACEEEKPWVPLAVASTVSPSASTPWARSASASSGARIAPRPRAMRTSSSRRTRRTGRSRAGTVVVSMPLPHVAVPIPRWMGPVPCADARCSERAMSARARSRARPRAMGSRMSRLRRTGCSVYSWARPPGCAPDRDSVGSDALSAAMSRSRRERHASRAVPTRVVGCVEVDEAEVASGSGAERREKILGTTF